MELNTEIIQKCDNYIRCLAYKYGLSYEDYEDIRQEAFVRILCANPKKPTMGRYIRVARNAAVEYLKSKRHHYSFNDKFKHISYESMIDVGFQIDTNGILSDPSLEHGKIYSKNKGFILI